MMISERFTKKVLKKTFKKQKQNLVKLYFDIFFKKQLFKKERFEERFEEIKKEVVEIDGKIATYMVPSMKARSKEKINELEKKKRELQQEAIKIREDYSELYLWEDSLERGIKVAQELEEVLKSKNILTIYEQRESKPESKPESESTGKSESKSGGEKGRTTSSTEHSESKSGK